MPHSHHLALVQGSSSSKPWADNGPFQAAWCLQPAGALAMVSLPGVGSALAPALDMPALIYQRRQVSLGAGGMLLSPHSSCWGSSQPPSFSPSILLAHRSPLGCCSGCQLGISQRSLVLRHQHGPQLCVQGLAPSLWEPPRPAALNSHKSKTKLNRGWGTACPLFPPSPLPGD